MTSDIGVWEPRQPAKLDEAKLQHYIALFANADPINLGAAMSDDDIKADASLMQLPESAWQLAEGLDDAGLESLVRFFTLAEMQLPGWEGGKQSPVIYLVRIMKARGSFTPELRKWIKATTDNRYLPYGSVL